MTVTEKNDVRTAHIKEYGHDYEIIEPLEYSYYWDLYSHVYHPMVINGTATVLVKDDTVAAADVDNINTFAIKGKVYRKSTDTENVLTASNYRRSNLNLTKEVSSETANDTLFSFEVTITDKSGHDIWFSAFENGAVVTDDIEITGKDGDGGTVAVEKEIINGINGSFTGFYHAPSGTVLTMKIKAGWNVRFLNLLHGSTYSFKELDLPNGFSFEKVEGTVEYPNDENNKPYAYLDQKVFIKDARNRTMSGTILYPNNSYTVTFTNKAESFYVYHSSDNTVEKIFISDSRVISTYDEMTKTYSYTFIIVNETKKDSLYGGYYSVYGGTTASDAEIMALEYKNPDTEEYTYAAKTVSANNWATDSKGKTYTPNTNSDRTGFWSAEKALLVNGTEMVPKINTVYYLKEVPDTYLRPSQFQTFKTYTRELNGFYLLTAVDDANYREVGFGIGSTETETAALYDLLTISYEEPLTAWDDVTQVETKDFSGKNVEGLIAMKEYELSYPKGATSLRKMITPYFITPDGMKVTGARRRMVILNDRNEDGIVQYYTKEADLSRNEISGRDYIVSSSAAFTSAASSFSAMTYTRHKGEGSGSNDPAPTNPDSGGNGGQTGGG